MGRSTEKQKESERGREQDREMEQGGKKRWAAEQREGETRTGAGSRTKGWKRMKIVTGCRTEMDELKKKKDTGSRSVTEKKGTGAGQHWRNKTTVRGSGTERWRKEKY